VMFVGCVLKLKENKFISVYTDVYSESGHGLTCCYLFNSKDKAVVHQTQKSVV
jgi:hypothetical protein